MLSRPWPLEIDPSHASRDPHAWMSLSRSEALRLQSSGALVAVASPFGASTKFEEGCPYLGSAGPYDYSVLRYYVHVGAATPRARASAGAPSRAKTPAADSAAADPEAEPMDETEDMKQGGLFNLVWCKPGDEEEFPIESAVLGAKLHLKVDTEGLMPGDSLQFHILRKSDGVKLAMVTGRVGENRSDYSCLITWTATEKSGDVVLKAGDKVKAICRFADQGLECRGPALSLGVQEILGGVKVQFTDPFGKPLQGIRGKLKREGAVVSEGDWPDGLLHVEELMFGNLEAELEWNGNPIRAILGWQRAPIEIHHFPLKWMNPEDGQ